MHDEIYTINQLNSMTVHDLRVALSKLGGVPGQSKRSELINQIRDIQSGKIKPNRSTRGRKPKFKQTEKLFNVPENSSVPSSVNANIFRDFSNDDDGDIAGIDKSAFSTPNPNVGKGYDEISDEIAGSLFGIIRKNGYILHTSYGDISVPQNVTFYDSGVENVETVIAHGVLEILPDGYGFLRNFDALSRYPDFYVDRQQIKSKRLRTGDFIVGYATNKFDKNCLNVHEIVKINDEMFNMSYEFRTSNFEHKTAIYPNRKIVVDKDGDITMRFLDIACPIGFGQRGLIVAPPRTGKTTILKKLANSIQDNHPNAHLIVLLIDERPEEVTDFANCLPRAEVIASTFDQSPERHTRIAEIYLERAKRLVEAGKDVVILMDSITKLARAYNNSMPSSGKLLSGGIDPNALVLPKKFFGSARNFEDGGSLTIIATALVETGSKLDEVIFEEFKGTGNMEILLSRDLSNRRIFPAIDLLKSGTRNEELLLSEEEINCLYKIRKYYSENPNAHEEVVQMLKDTATNKEILSKL